MATHTISVDTNIHDITDWADYDTVDIQSGATFTIDNSGNGLEVWKIGQILVRDNAKLLIKNTTQDGLQILSNQYYIIITYGSGEVRFEGDLIPLHTSDGTTGQTFTFWDTNYGYDIAGLFIQDDTYGLVMNEYNILPDSPVHNQYTRLFEYDKDTATFTLNDYIPPNGKEIYAPNILIKTEGDNENTGIGTSYIKIEFSQNFYAYGVYFGTGFLTSGHKNFTMEYCIIPTVAGYLANVNGVTLKNIVAVYDAYWHYFFYLSFCSNITIENATFYGRSAYRSLKNATFTNIYVMSARGSDDRMGFDSSDNVTITNWNSIYTEFGGATNSSNFLIKDFFQRYDDDYTNAYASVVYLKNCKDFYIDNLTVCENFNTDVQRIFGFYEGCLRCKVVNTWIDIYHCNDVGGYYPSFMDIQSSEYCGLVNSGWSNSRATSSTKLMYYETAKNCFVVDGGVYTQGVLLRGTNNTYRDLKLYNGTMNVSNTYGHALADTYLYNTDGSFNGRVVYFFPGTLTEDYVEFGGNTHSDMTTHTVYFENAGDYAIFKTTKEMGAFRGLSSILSYGISGNNTGNLDFYISFDYGETWIAESDWTGTEIPKEVDWWVKIVSNTDASSNGDTYVTRIYWKVDPDDNGLAYNPEVYYGRLLFNNLPTNVNFKLSMQVGSDEPKYYENIMVQDNETPYELFEIWKRVDEEVTLKFKHYEYESFVTKTVITRDTSNVFYLGAPTGGLTKTYEEAIALEGVEIIYNESYHEHDLFWDYTLDCGGHDLEDVYHYIKAMNATNDMFFGRNGLDWWQMLQRDGNGFMSVMNEGHGVRVINYVGTLTKTQSNSGEFYFPAEFVNLRLRELEPGSRVIIYEIDENGNYIKILEDDYTGDGVTYSYIYEGDKKAKVSIFKDDRLPVVFEVVLGATDQLYNIEQPIDRNYYDPSAPRLVEQTFGLKKNTDKTFSIEDIFAYATFEGHSFDGHTCTGLEITKQPENGVLTDNGDGTFTYTPNSDYVGQDSFSFIPIYDVVYPGIITEMTCNFNIMMYYSDKQIDNIIIAGDSLNRQIYQMFDDPYIGERYFPIMFRATFNRNIKMIEKAVGGYTTDDVIAHFDDIFNEELADLPGNTLVYMILSGNDMSPVREGTVEDIKARLDKVYDNMVYLYDRVRERFPNFYILFDEEPAKRFDDHSKDRDTWVFDPIDYRWNKEELGTAMNNWAMGIEDQEKHLRKMIADKDDPELVTSYSSTLTQFYNTMRQEVYLQYGDMVHPNIAGSFTCQEALMNALLYYEYGVKPIEIDKFGFRTIYINLSDDDVIEDYTQQANDPDNTVFKRQINNWNVTTDSSITPIIDDGSDSGITFTIELENGGTPEIYQEEPSEFDVWKGNFLFDEYYRRFIRITSDNPLYLKINGLENGKIYRMNIAVSAPKELGATDARRAKLLNTRNGYNHMVEGVDGHLYDENGDPIYRNNKYIYLTSLILADGNEEVFKIYPDDEECYIAAIKFYKVSDGE